MLRYLDVLWALDRYWVTKHWAYKCVQATYLLNSVFKQHMHWTVVVVVVPDMSSISAPIAPCQLYRQTIRYQLTTPMLTSGHWPVLLAQGGTMLMLCSRNLRLSRPSSSIYLKFCWRKIGLIEHLIPKTLSSLFLTAGMVAHDASSNRTMVIFQFFDCVVIAHQAVSLWNCRVC